MRGEWGDWQAWTQFLDGSGGKKLYGPAGEEIVFRAGGHGLPRRKGLGQSTRPWVARTAERALFDRRGTIRTFQSAKAALYALREVQRLERLS